MTNYLLELLWANATVFPLELRHLTKAIVGEFQQRFPGVAPAFLTTLILTRFVLAAVLNPLAYGVSRGKRDLFVRVLLVADLIQSNQLRRSDACCC
jgi:hypothetical protein